MDVNISDIVSTVHVVDGDVLLAPQTLAKIVQVVLQAVHEQKEHGMRVQAEVRISGGVHDEQTGEGR